MAGSRGAVFYYRLNQTSPCIDADGDGFGWNGTNTSTPAPDSVDIVDNTNNGCDYSNADSNGGWGWNATTSQSCTPLENIGNTQPTAQCIDTDGDGWGWDGVVTCIVSVDNPGASASIDSQ